VSLIAFLPFFDFSSQVSIHWDNFKQCSVLQANFIWFFDFVNLNCYFATLSLLIQSKFQYFSCFSFDNFWGFCQLSGLQS